MIWLFVAVWVQGQPMESMKVLEKVGPFQTYQQCWSAGALAANKIQMKDNVSWGLGACGTETSLTKVSAQPFMLQFKPMWSMVCASLGKTDLCWLKDGRFVDPLAGGKR